MQTFNHNIGDMVKVPQNVLLVNQNKKWLRLPEPEYGVILGVHETHWPIEYQIFVHGGIWRALEGDIFPVE